MSVILSVKLHHTAYSRPYQYSIIHSPTTKYGACSRICTYTLSHHLLRATCLLFHHTGKFPRVGVEPTCCNTHGRTELNRPASWDMERIPGLEPRTARRQRAVLPLNYIRMEEGWGLAPHPLSRAICFQDSCSTLACLTFQMVVVLGLEPISCPYKGPALTIELHHIISIIQLSMF